MAIKPILMVGLDGQALPTGSRTRRQSYTPTGPYTGTATYTGFWSRDNEDILIDIDVAFSGIPTGNLAIFTYAQLLNGLGLTVDTAKLPNITNSIIPCGGWSILDDGVTIYNGVVTANVVNVELYKAASGIVSAASPLALNSGDNLGISIRLPITGW